MRASLTFGALGCSLLLAIPAHAQWPAGGRALCNFNGDQDAPVITSDGAGGAIAAWIERRVNADDDVYAVRVLAGGAIAPGWIVNGTPVCTLAGYQYGVSIIGDGAGGAFIAWHDTRNSSTTDVYAQHLDAAGNIVSGWPLNGLAIVIAPGNQANPVMTLDGTGGAIIAWQDSRASDSDVISQRVSAGGVLQWAGDGAQLVLDPYDQINPVICSDGAGGALVAWLDSRGTAGTTGNDIYAQHVTATGVLASGWSLGALAVCRAKGNQTRVSIAPDGSGGAYVCWEDPRTSTYTGTSHIFAQRITGAGGISAGWPTDGEMVCASNGTQQSPFMIGDGAGGAIIAWQDSRSSTFDVYLKRITGTGATASGWATTGLAACSAAGDQLGGRLVLIPGGGALLAWQDGRQSVLYGWDVFAQSVTGAGAISSGWPADGVPVCSMVGDQTSAVLVSDGANGAVVAFRDGRTSGQPTGTGLDIYAQHVSSSGFVTGVEDGVDARALRLLAPHPNPARTGCTIDFELRADTPVSLEVLDLAGRRVRALASRRTLTAGRHSLAWDGCYETGEVAKPGVYFVRLEASGNTASRRLALLR